jgi:hypothetical protein
MIKAIMDNDAGDRAVLIALSFEDIAKLRSHPCELVMAGDFEDAGLLPGVKFLVFSGRTEADMRQFLVECLTSQMMRVGGKVVAFGLDFEELDMLESQPLSFCRDISGAPLQIDHDFVLMSGRDHTSILAHFGHLINERTIIDRSIARH